MCGPIVTVESDDSLPIVVDDSEFVVQRNDALMSSSAAAGLEDWAWSERDSLSTIDADGLIESEAFVALAAELRGAVSEPLFEETDQVPTIQNRMGLRTEDAQRADVRGESNSWGVAAVAVAEPLAIDGPPPLDPADFIQAAGLPEFQPDALLDEDSNPTTESPIPLSGRFLVELEPTPQARPSMPPRRISSSKLPSLTSGLYVRPHDAPPREASARGSPYGGSQEAPVATPFDELAARRGSAFEPSAGARPPRPQSRVKSKPRSSPRSRGAPKPQTRAQPAVPAGGGRLSERAQKASRLFEQALEDKDNGNFASAHMNMKLALMFDPMNEVVQAALAALERNPAARPKNREELRTEARQLYEEGRVAESGGRFETAIEQYESALSLVRSPIYLNRLGMLLATEKRDYPRALALVEEAVRMRPGYAAYSRNLEKIRWLSSMGDSKSGKAKKRSLFGGLFNRR
ncbi:MAG: hypothetical protein AAFN74_03595 [Myxococcota bacterium]